MPMPDTALTTRERIRAAQLIAQLETWRINNERPQGIPFYIQSGVVISDESELHQHVTRALSEAIKTHHTTPTQTRQGWLQRIWRRK
jgi:hypothetical protein